MDCIFTYKHTHTHAALVSTRKKSDLIEMFFSVFSLKYELLISQKKKNSVFSKSTSRWNPTI